MLRLPVPSARVALPIIRARHAARILGVLLVAVALGGCTGGGAGATSAPAAGSVGTSPASSGAANPPCPSAPAPGGDIEGWPTPGSVSTASVVPVVVSSEQVCGPNRFVFSFLAADNRPVADPTRTASVAFFDLAADPATPTEVADGTFVWGIEGVTGFYVASVTFSRAGEWGAEFRTKPKGEGAVPEAIRLRFEVRPTGSTVAVGEPAPASDTPTAADVGGDLAKLSSDQAPEPSFYRTSVADALAAGTPFALVFATPAFCTSGQCGPTLDRVKLVAKAHPGVTVINVEPYQLEYADGRLQPVLDANGQLQPVQAVIDWGIVSEPWIFTVDGDGIVRGSFEGVVGEDELGAAFDAIAKAP